MQPGKHTRKIAMFVPESSQGLAKFNAWLMGKRPEFVNPRVVATGESRDGRFYSLIFFSHNNF